VAFSFVGPLLRGRASVTHQLVSKPPACLFACSSSHPLSGSNIEGPSDVTMIEGGSKEACCPTHAFSAPSS
jgi:hypothetical protein